MFQDKCCLFALGAGIEKKKKQDQLASKFETLLQILQMLGPLGDYASLPAGKGALLPRVPSTCNLKYQHCTDGLPGATMWFSSLRFRVYVFEV